MVLEEACDDSLEGTGGTDVGVVGGDVGDTFALVAVLLVRVMERRFRAAREGFLFLGRILVIRESCMVGGKVEVLAVSNEGDVGDGEGGASAGVSAGGFNDLTWPVHVVEADDRKVTDMELPRGQIWELEEGPEDGHSAGEHAAGRWVLFLESP